MYTLRDVPKLLKKRSDPWKGYLKLKQRIKVLDDFIKQLESGEMTQTQI